MHPSLMTVSQVQQKCSYVHDEFPMASWINNMPTTEESCVLATRRVESDWQHLSGNQV